MEKDLNNLTKEELILKIKQLQKEKKLNNKYGLVWDKEREPEQVVELCKNKIPILKNIKSKDIKTNDSADNILIEGDNYHALQVLNYTHKGKIDVIYIDPPYNTGNKDFKYNDTFVDREDGYRHSKWLNFMSKRLELARNLLSGNGVVFISIDDNELSNLKLLSDQIFGENNFVCNFIWQKNFAPKNDNKYISISTDYILCFAKKIESFKRNLLPRTDKQNSLYKNIDNDFRGDWTSGSMLATTFSQSGVFEIKAPNGKVHLPPKGRCWRFSQSKIKELIEDNRIYWGSKGNNVPRIKRFLKEMPNGIVPQNLLLYENIGSNQDGNKEMRDIFNAQVFDFPKPVSLILHLLRISTNKNSTILDFFAGSGTTGHAVLELNKQDGGNRKFILCTNNENNICTDVCYPRIQKVINGYNKNGNDEFVEGLGSNLKYFKTDFVKNSKNITQAKINVSKNCAEMLCIKTGIFNEIENNQSYKIFDNNTHNEFLCVFFDFYNDNMKKFISSIKKLKGIKHIFLFSLDSNIEQDLFEDIPNAFIEPIPQKILDIYKKLSK